MKKQEIKDGFGLYTTRRTLPMALLRARELREREEEEEGVADF